MSEGRYGVYVHVPWCRAVCPYCHFAVTRDDGAAPFEAYVDAVHREYATRRVDFAGPAATVSLGGGTPSRLPTRSLRRLLAGIERTADAEVTLEANPEDVTEEWLAGAIEAGMTRLSLGVQSLDTATAQLLGRGHTERLARQTLKRVALSPLASWSADLIFAVPGQSLEDVQRDLDDLLELQPPHVSLYGLTFEPDTPFERRRLAGTLVPVPDDRWRAMYDALTGGLRAAGLERYEVSNFARPGHASLHNQLYWTDAPYLGLGPSSHGYAPDGRRWVNTPTIAAYLDQTDPTATSERPSPEEAATDLLLTALRTRDGLSVEQLRRRTGHQAHPTMVSELQQAGLLGRTPGRLALTDAGFPVADAVIARLAGALILE